MKTEKENLIAQPRGRFEMLRGKRLGREEPNWGSQMGNPNCQSINVLVSGDR